MMSGRWLRIAPERQLDAVADDVVLEGLDGQRVLRVQRLQPALRHGERVVAEVDLPGLLVQLVHREVDDPAEAERVLSRPGPSSSAEPRAHRAGELRRRLGLAGDEEHRVAGATARRRRGSPRRGRLPGCARSGPSGRPRRRRYSRARRRPRPAPRRSACRRSCAAAPPRPAPGWRAPRRPRRRCARTARSPSRRRPRVTSPIRSGLRRSGLSVPYSSIALS